MKTKDATVQCTFHPALTALLFGIDQVWRQEWNEEIIITSGSEQTTRHSYSSLHYATPCQAADIRSWVTGKIPEAKRQVRVIEEVVYTFCKNLDIPYDWIEVILESDHIHIEYQPKRLEGI